MYRFDIKPDQLMKEFYNFNSKLAEGFSTLQNISDLGIGKTEKKEIYSEDKLKLYHYVPRTSGQQKTPILVVYALVNRPYMADLQEGRSLIQGLLDHGLDVYIIDWGYPDLSDRYLSLDDYINGYLDRCVDQICQHHDLSAINLLGICQGGTFSCCYGALHREKVKNLILTVTPIDFHTKNDLLSHMVRDIDVDLLVDTLGNISGELLNTTFLSLKPYQLNFQKYADFVSILDDSEKVSNFLRMEKWIFDSPDQAGEAYLEFIKGCYQGNQLIKNEFKVGEQSVQLDMLTMPILNIFARDDHLVPPESSRALGDYVGTKDYKTLEFPGGHIGVYVSGKSQKMIPPSVRNWLADRD